VSASNRRALVVGALGLLALVVAAAGFLLVIKPQHSKLSATTAKVAAAQEQLSSLHQKGTKPPAIRAVDLFTLARAMPNVDDTAGVVVDLTQLAKASRLQLVGIRPSPRVALANGSSALPMTVTVNGKWKELSSFLRAIRRRVSIDGGRPLSRGRLYNVDEVQIQSGTGSFETQAVLTMDAFDYGAPPSPTATAGVTGATGRTTTGSTTTTSTTTTASSG
jgi:Tfp pilus assembly protein PilO